MNRESLIRNLLIATMISALALTACGRKTETHDPDTAAPADNPATTEQPMDDSGTGTTTDDTSGDNTLSDDNTSSDDMTSGDSGNDATAGTASPSPEDELICTETWFKWVNDQVLSMHSEVIAEQYPSGLPDVGSDEWFVAVDKLTGGDGAHGPDGGSDEWCTMVQQRLGTTDSNQQ